MIRFLVRTAVLLAANAVGLIVASIVLDGFDIDFTGFVVALVVYTVALALMQPFLEGQLRRRNSSVLGGVSLIATLIALIVSDLVSDGLSISGIGTWAGAMVIVWLTTVLAAFILPFLGLKKYLEERREAA